MRSELAPAFVVSVVSVASALMVVLATVISVAGCECGTGAIGLDAATADADRRDAADARVRADDGSADASDDANTAMDGDLGDASLDAGVALDGTLTDDASAIDAPADSSASDDASTFDAGTDGGPPDAGPPDAGPPDAGPPDAGPPDAGPPDAGPATGGCVSGAVGTHVARFRWAGSGSGSTAYVVYEANTLPDTSRWRAGAYSMSIGYTPVYGDTFLGPGGLEMSGTVFMDIELSTIGLSSLSNVTIAIFGRSYNTTASGSFTWQTFSGTGATPSGSIANSTPYRWYPGNATTAFRTGDGGVLLRLRAGPPSGALVVNRVEICFTGT